MRIVLALALVTLAACAAASPDYRVGGLANDWKKLEVDGSDVTFKHKDGGTIFANRQCQGIDDVPLDVLTNHLFFDMRIDREISRKEITIAGRGALRTHVLAELDGVPVELDVVVLKKDGCTYDLALVADRGEFDARRPDFETFLHGFDQIEKGEPWMKRLALSDAKNRAVAWTVEKIEHLGGVVDLGRRTTIAVFRPPLMFGELVRQLENIGVRSLPIVLLTAIFSSLVMTVQMGVQLSRFGSIEYVGNVVSLSMVRELGPVLTALLVGGRVGAGIAAELGSMAVTEQVDAIRSMGADPVKKLVVPRVLASVIVLPLLTTLADVIGSFASAVIAKLEYGIGMKYFLSSIAMTVTLGDFLGGLMKTVVFGFFLGLIACHEGLNTRGGTEGVGLATTHAVVVSSVVTLITDFVLTSILLSMGY